MMISARVLGCVFTLAVGRARCFSWNDDDDEDDDDDEEEDDDADDDDGCCCRWEWEGGCDVGGFDGCDAA